MFVGCEKDVEKMTNESSSEHLQPMKDKMEQFINNARQLIEEINAKLSSTQEHFDKVTSQLYKLCVSLII